jgi:3-oxoacyl-[acyl-carrier protein] reductase
VVVTDIHERRTQEVATAIAADYPATTVAGYPLDADDRDRIDAVIDAVTAALGPVQILVNNAAINIIGGIFDYDPADWGPGGQGQPHRPAAPCAGARCR